MNILPALVPYTDAIGQCAVRNVPAWGNAWKILEDLGLNPSPKVIVNKVLDPYNSFGGSFFGEYKRHLITFSYDFIEAGTEEMKDERGHNNIASWSPFGLQTLLIHYFPSLGRTKVGRRYGLKVNEWITY